MPLIVVEKNTAKKTPHLAVCHEAQGGSANGRHVSLLMKSEGTIELTDEIVKSLESLGLENFPEEIQKAVSYRTLRRLLQDALEKAYESREYYSYVYVEDFTETDVIFGMSTEHGYELLKTSYSIEGVNIVVGDEAFAVVEIADYVVVEGKVQLTHDAKERIMEEAGIVEKAFAKEEVQVQLLKQYEEFTKSKEQASLAASDDTKHNQTEIKNPENPLENFEEILKSAEGQAWLQTAIEKANADLQTKLAEAQAVAEEAQEVLKAAAKVAEQELTVFVKSHDFICEEMQAPMIAFLMKSAKTEDNKLITDVLKAANDAIIAAKEELQKAKEEFALADKGQDGIATVTDQDPQEFLITKAKQLWN